jgi:hypothetical protein
MQESVVLPPYEEHELWHSVDQGEFAGEKLIDLPVQNPFE